MMIIINNNNNNNNEILKFYFNLGWHETCSFIALDTYWQARTYRVCNHRRIGFDYECNIAYLVSELQLCVLTAAPSENSWWRFTANHRTGFNV